MDRRCPDPESRLADIVVEPWQNFAGEHAEYADRLEALGVALSPRHARIELTHSCGWAVSLPAGPLSAVHVVKEIADHLGAPLLAGIDAGVASAVSREQDTPTNQGEIHT